MSARTTLAGKPGKHGMARILAAARYSMAGFRAAWQREESFRQELALVLVLVPAGLWLGRNAIERSLLLSVCLIMLLTELLNSSLEALIDRFSLEQHELSRMAKDMGSAAVFVSLALAALVWGLIAAERFIA